jgi:hypothetical protein
MLRRKRSALKNSRALKGWRLHFAALALTLGFSFLAGDAHAQSVYSSLSYSSLSCSSGQRQGLRCSASGGSLSVSSFRPSQQTSDPVPRRRWNTTLLERQGLFSRPDWAPADGSLKFTVVNP